MIFHGSSKKKFPSLLLNPPLLPRWLSVCGSQGLCRDSLCCFFFPVPSSRLMTLCQQRALEEHGKRKDLLRLVLVLLSFHFSCLWLQFGWASRWGHPGGSLPYMDVRNKEPPLYHASSPNIQNPDRILHSQAQISDAWTSWHTHCTLTLMLLSLVLNHGTAVFLQHSVSIATVS